MIASVLCFAAWFPPPGRGAEVDVAREIYLMGTRCTLTTRAPEREGALRQLEQMILSLEESERQLSTWRADSEISIFNRQPVGSPLRISSSLLSLFQKLAFWNAATDRAFDPAIGTLVAAWGLRAGGRWPSGETLREAMERCGMEFVSVAQDSGVAVRERDVTLDCGAFGKGEALDRLRAQSLEQAFWPWLVNLGGQVAVSGPSPSMSDWNVSLSHPGMRSVPAAFIRLSAGSLATSGGSERDIRKDGRRIGHVLDPRTGSPAGFDGSVSVWHESALVADILSTALYVMGPERGIAWAEARGIAACYLRLPEGNERAISFSTAFAPLLQRAPAAATEPQTSLRPPPF